MGYKVNLEKCKKFGEGLILPDGTFIGGGEIEAYFGKIELGKFEVKNVSNNLENFLKYAREVMEARKKDLGIGPIIIYGEGIRDIANRFFKQYSKQFKSAPAGI